MIIIWDLGFNFSFCVHLSFSGVQCEREIIVVAYMNVHGLCRKARSDLCRIFHTESLGISPHNAEKEDKKENNRKKTRNSDLHYLRHAFNRQNQSIGILTLMRNLDKNSATPQIVVLDLLH